MLTPFVVKWQPCKLHTAINSPVVSFRLTVKDCKAKSHATRGTPVEQACLVASKHDLASFRTRKHHANLSTWPSSSPCWKKMLPKSCRSICKIVSKKEGYDEMPKGANHPDSPLGGHTMGTRSCRNLRRGKTSRHHSW